MAQWSLLDDDEGAQSDDLEQKGGFENWESLVSLPPVWVDK